jgi:polyhydroxybutyrate depolymerase
MAAEGETMKAVQADRPGSGSTPQSLARITRGSIDLAGRQRSYTLAEPPGAGTGTSLVLIFHGSNQTGEKFRAFTGNSFDAVASTSGAVVAYLDGYRGHWNDARAASGFAARTENIDDVAFTEAMISELQASHRIDRSKVYAAGFSNGGQMVIRLIHQVPGLLAGAAIISATQPAPDNFLLDDAPAVPLPVALIHGTRDPIVNYEGGAMSWWARQVFRAGGISLSAPQTAAYFAARNAITTPPAVTDLPHREESGKTSVTRTDYQQSGKFPVTLYSVRAGGHTIPGPRSAPFVMGRTSHDLNAAEAISEFFGLTLPAEPPKAR